MSLLGGLILAGRGLTLAALVSVLLAGCTLIELDKQHDRQFQGLAISDQLLQQAQQDNVDKVWLLTYLGDPDDSHRLNEHEEVLTYVFQTKERSVTRVFPLFTRKQTRLESEIIHFRLNDGKVIKSWRDLAMMPSQDVHLADESDDD